MELGFFTMPLHPPGRNYIETLKEDREAIIMADRLGFSEAYVGEHTTDLAETIPSCLMFLSSLVHATCRVKLGTGTLNLPNGHPAAFAANVAMLDNMLEGRLIVGISPGGLPSDMEAFENLDRDRKAMFLECINTMIAIWTGDAPYNIKGQFWNVSTERTLIPEIGQGTILKPYQRPHPPIVITAVEPFSAGVTAAAARGWEPISANFLLPRWVKSHWDKYTAGCAQAGRRADPANWRVAKSIFVCEDGKVAQAYGKGENSPYRFYYKQLLHKLRKAGRTNLFKESKDAPDESVTLDGVVDRLVMAGTPEEVAEQILALRAETGDFGTLLYAGTDWADPALGKRSMELLAEKVMPMVNRAIAAEQPLAA
jgi:alkanesulfonate monooxygenase SsuD/methylene tetrahydromethanopterin reductase-like flavin-dependent oxidoreductase (luciferase family)